MGTPGRAQYCAKSMNVLSRIPPRSSSQRSFASALTLSTGAALIVIVTMWTLSARRDEVFESPSTLSATPHRELPTASAVADFNPTIWASDRAQIASLQMSPNDKYLAARVSRNQSPQDSHLLVIEVESRRIILDILNAAVSRVLICFAPTSDAVAVYSPENDAPAGSPRGVLTIYRLRDKAKKFELDITRPGYAPAVYAIGISHDARSVAAQYYSDSSFERSKAWDIDSKGSAPIESTNYSWVGGHFSPNGDRYSIGGWPGPGVRIGRCSTGEVVSYCLRDALPAVASSFADDGRLWSTVYDDGKLVVWDVREIPEKVARPLLLKGGFRTCTAFSLSHSLKHLIYGKSDGTIRMMPLRVPPLH